MHLFDDLFIELTNLSSLLLSFHSYGIVVVKIFRVKTYFQKVIFLGYFSPDVEFKIIPLWSFIFDISVFNC